MLSYKWTFKSKDAGILYYLIHVFDDGGALLARKADGEIGTASSVQFNRNFIFVEETI